MNESEDEDDDGRWDELLADPERAGSLLADADAAIAFARAMAQRIEQAEQLEREHSDLEMLHEATLEHSNEIEEELALKIEEVESLVKDLEVRNGFIRAIFGRYLSDDVVTTLLESPEALRLGGERRKVTILLTDLRGFSAISERLSPEQVVGLLNIYLGTMASVIDSYEGSINEFIGDAILTVFGAPIDHEDAAERAVACALSMQLAMADVNAACVAEGLPRIEMGIGVHTGEVIVGNIGSKRRTKYGLVGRNVNLASRVETYTVGGQVLISDATAAEVPGLMIRDRFHVKPKGFKGEITIHEVVGIEGRYNVRLPEQVETLTPLAAPVPVRLTVVDGKDVGGPEESAFIEAVGEASALVRVAIDIDPLTNVKLDFADELFRDDVYAKVVGDGGAKSTLRLRFTPMPDGLPIALRREGRPSGAV